jgi:hypothetical protein
MNVLANIKLKNKKKFIAIYFGITFFWNPSSALCFFSLLQSPLSFPSLSLESNFWWINDVISNWSSLKSHCVYFFHSFLAWIFKASLALTLSTKTSLLLYFLRCSILTWILSEMILPFCFLLTMTPRALSDIENSSSFTMITQWGIPLWIKPSAIISTQSPMWM